MWLWNSVIEKNRGHGFSEIDTDLYKCGVLRISDLLVAGSGALPPDRRVVVLSPLPVEKAGTRFRTIDQVFIESRKGGQG
ncbi:MAG: hypothetical protein JSW26_11350 [Desulfobacterales bacterium]|nr:MAG: hypothetical protein JSW26_11350 [Desulfobacterales bacterium]